MLLTLSVNEDLETVRSNMHVTGFAISMVLDHGEVVATRYALLGLPTHVFLDKEGMIRDIRVVALNRQAIKKRLATIPSSQPESARR